MKRIRHTTQVGDWIQPCHDGVGADSQWGPLPARLGMVHKVERIYPDGAVGYRRGNFLFVSTSWIRRPAFKQP